MAARTSNNHGFMERMKRLLHLKLVIPLHRSRHSPEYSARGVAIGMFWALTPLVGIQMYLCVMTWFAFKPFKKLNFSLVIACAWTWTTNVFTMFPIYYLFYATGQVMRGEWNNITGYETFLMSWDEAFVAKGHILQSVLDLMGLLAKELGISMGLGCLPYAVIGTWISYKLSLQYVRRKRRRAHEKSAQKDTAKTINTMTKKSDA